MKQFICDSMHKLELENDNQHSIVVWAEPWAHDFTLLPGEKMSIEAWGKDLSFQIVMQGSDYQIWINGEVAEWLARSQGMILPCGYQREMAVKK